VYVESNFVLVVALMEEQAFSAIKILDLSEAGRIDLVFPIFAISEPFGTVAVRGRRRKRLCNRLKDQVRELKRSEPRRSVVSQVEPVAVTLLQVEKEEFDLLESTVQRLLGVGRAIGINESVFRDALAYEKHYGLAPQDAIIYSAIVTDLKRSNSLEQKCFISRNWKDFRDPEIESELATYNCTYLEDFAAGLDFASRASSTAHQ
jgi:predicted nucleic acid-binding protein